jgi:hypothetical protein
MLGCGMKTAWHLGHRIRFAMDPVAFDPMGGDGKTVEADETEIAPSRKTKRKEGHRRSDNIKVLSLVQRGGDVRSVVIDHRTIGGMVVNHIHPDTRLVTDKAQHYKAAVAKHESVDHSKFEWVRGDVHTNTLENYFSVFKRGLVGTYQHMDSKHFERYLAEFDFRYNTRAKLGIDDRACEAIAVQGAKGKRLTYQTIGG